jgi:GntR family transcriptional regulator / MocR family aminotransferase
MSNNPAFTSSIVLDSTATVPLFRQLYESLRQAILAGQFLPGAQLPPTRTLADHLHVSRNTVHSAYVQLADEGYIEGVQGSGTRVSPTLPDSLSKTHRHPQAVPSRLQGNRKVSRRGTHLVTVYQDQTYHKPGLADIFKTGVPALDHFPYTTWRRLLVQSWHAMADGSMLGHRGDHPPLRQAIAHYLGTTRGVRCTAEQIIIVAGSQQGIDLALRVLLDPGQKALIEDPCYPGAYGAMLGAGITPIPLPVDAEGMSIGNAQSARARLAYITPSHQYPLGMTMSLRRRLEMLDWAERKQAWIIEDDYHSEFRYTGRPLAALQGLDHQNRVMYLGTFSKVLFPALRLAYLVVPPDLVEVFTAARRLASHYPPLLEQMTLAAFIERGHFSRHLRRMLHLYAKRQNALVTVAANRLKGLLRLPSTEAGMHAIGWLPAACDDRQAARQAAKLGLYVSPLSDHTLKNRQPNALILGYTAGDEKAIRQGIGVLARALR